MDKRCWLHNKRALSPIFATVLLAVIIISIGSVAFYFSNNLTKSTTDNVIDIVSSSKQSMSERIGFENLAYDSAAKTLTVSIINCGLASNLKISGLIIYDINHNIVGQPYSGSAVSALSPINTAFPSPTPITSNSLNVGQEAYFTVYNVAQSNGSPLSSESIYTLHLITQSGSLFYYDFMP
jgi:hypothetical protein